MPVSGAGPYDANNIFARILRNEIPSNRVYEDEWAVAFHDIAPQAPVHILVIPRGPYVSLADFVATAPDAEIAGFFRAVGRVASSPVSASCRTWECTQGRKCRTSTSISSGALRSGPCSPDKTRPERHTLTTPDEGPTFARPRGALIRG